MIACAHKQRTAPIGGEVRQDKNVVFERFKRREGMPISGGGRVMFMMSHSRPGARFVTR